MSWTTKWWSRNYLLSYLTLYNHEYDTDIEIEGNLKSSSLSIYNFLGSMIR